MRKSETRPPGYVEQVGGSHYGGVNNQHWDLMELWDISYLEAIASKHVTRLRRRGSYVKDLRKAISYVQKIRTTRDPPKARRVVPRLAMGEWCRENGMDADQEKLMFLLHAGGGSRDLERAEGMLSYMLRERLRLPWVVRLARDLWPWAAKDLG